MLIVTGLLLLVPSVASAAEPKILYSVEGRSGVVATSGKTMQVILPAGSRTTWFTSRPARASGTLTLGRLAAIWDASGFRDDPPNAALLLSHRGVTRSHVVTLTNPRRAKGRVSFRVRVVRGGTEAGHRHRDPLRAGRYGRAQLFIDDAANPPCPSTVSSFTRCIIASGSSVSVSANQSQGHPLLGVDLCPIGSGTETLESFYGGLAIATAEQGDVILPSQSGGWSTDFAWCPTNLTVAILSFEESADGELPDGPQAAVQVLWQSFPGQSALLTFGPTQ